MITDNNKIYNDPFETLSSWKMPRTMNDLYDFCIYAYYNNPLIHPVVHKMAEYSITDLVYDIPNADLKKSYETVFNEDMQLKSLMIDIGIDWYVLGTILLTVINPFERRLECKNGNCGELNAFKKVKNIKFSKSDGGISGICPECKYEGMMLMKDIPFKQEGGKHFAVKRWSPKEIEIIENPYSLKKKYLYNVPQSLKSKITGNDKFYLETTPKTVIDAIIEDKKIDLTGDIFHIKTPSLAGVDGTYGMPKILPALRMLFYMQRLMKSQEAIAEDHSVPLRMLFPESTGPITPEQFGSLVTFKNKVIEAIQKWREDDPNYIPFFPFPVGKQQLGGNMKSLSVSEELAFYKETVLNALETPIEFIKGGLSYSGSNVSLRMLENHFINHRRKLLDAVNFIIKQVAKFKKMDYYKAGLKDFKMADDIQGKQLRFNLYSSGLISGDTLLSAHDLDYNAEVEKIKNETADRAEIESAIALSGAQAEAKSIKEKTMAEVVSKMKAESEIRRQEVERIQDALQTYLGEDFDIREVTDEQWYKLFATAKTPMERKLVMDAMMILSPVMGEMIQQQLIESRMPDEENENKETNEKKEENNEKKPKEQEVAKDMPEQKPPRREGSSPT